MKKYIAVVVIMVLAFVVAPWGIGQVAHQRIEAGIDQIEKQSPYLKIVDRKWSSGWFRSQQEVTFDVLGPWQEIFRRGAHAQDAALPADPLRFTVRNEILHGPVLWPMGFGIARVNTRFVMSDTVRKALEEVFGTEEPFHVSTRVAFLGGGDTTFTVDGRDLSSTADHSRMKYDDLRLDVGYSSHLDHVDVDGNWPHFEFTDSRTGETVVADGIKLKARSKRIQGDLYDTDSAFTVDSFRAVGRDRAETTIDGMHYVIASTSKDDFLDYGIKLGSSKVHNDSLKALKLDLDEVHYDFTLRHLHTETLNKLVAAIKESYTRQVSSDAELDAAFTAPFKQYGLELLNHDPELAVDNLGIVTPDGVGVIKGVLRLKGVTAEDLNAGGMALLAKLQADLNVEISQKLLEKFPNGANSANTAIEQGYAKRDGDRVVSRIEFDHGQLKINGKEEAIPGMGGPPAQPKAE